MNVSARNNPADHYDETHKVGPYDVCTNPNELTLRMENRGELKIQGCALLAFTMLIVLALGVMSILQTAELNTQRNGFDNPDRFFAPTQNNFGFLWLFCSLAMLIAVPLYVKRAYKAALTFTFLRAEDVFMRDGKTVTRLKRVEHLALRESHDPDAKYLYLLHLVYNDGHQMMLHNGYDEREVMNLANEISAFVHKPVVWKS